MVWGCAADYTQSVCDGARWAAKNRMTAIASGGQHVLG